MNGDNKDEAHRPRPLSAGIWTLFSWLRRSERSSSSDSLSSVGSARTAISFDFLTPGNCKITSSPIVLTTSLNPPSETYKRRLQERNIRRQHDRDLTLHRKYGLYRELETGYDALSLPPARRTSGNSVERQYRDRRATSECLQRRAAYVPGKRRAPLPPLAPTSVSLPRTYKRKRPAPKPPNKNTTRSNNSLIPQINNPVQMTSNSEPPEKIINNNEKLSCGETSDNKVINSRDTKSRTEKSFLKHIFENKKRNSVNETTTIKLLPSISELDKQAAEIIENNKQRRNKNSLMSYNSNNPQNATALYEGNSWFCTSCLRKYESSVDSCNYCLPDIKSSLKKDGLKMLSPRSSIYTQTNSNIHSATSSQINMNEQKILKEILKEMKDSLPKKNKVIDIVTETPTLRIGSTMLQTYEDLKAQPSTSTKVLHNDNRLLSTSLSEPQRNYDNKKSVSNQQISPNAKTSSPLQNKIIQDKTTLLFENKSIKILNTNDQCNENIKIDMASQFLSDKTDKQYHSQQKIHTTNLIGNHNGSVQLKNPDMSMNINKAQNQSSSLLTKSSNNKEIYIKKPILRDGIKSDITKNDQRIVKAKSYLSTTSTNTEFETNPHSSSKLQFLNFSDSHAVVVNSVTVVTSHTNNNSETILSENDTKKCANKLRSEVQNGTIIAEIQLPFQSTSDPDVKKKTSESDANPILTRSSIDIKSESALHTPLKISALLNPLYSPKLTKIKENKSSGPDVSMQFQKELHNNSYTPKIIDKHDKKIIENVKTASELKTTNQGNDVREPNKPKETESVNHVVNKQSDLPSTSGYSGREKTTSENDLDKLNHYDRRRQIINQLEQSIAKGDEVAAAEAAVKLAKLRLSCSVLSFSSQIVGETCNIKRNVLETGKLQNIEKSVEKNTTHASLAMTQEHEINERTQKIESNIKLLENKVVTKDVIADGNKNDSNNVIPRLLNNVSLPSTSSSPSSRLMDDIVAINIWIEDKEATRGPIQLRISRRATMADIKRQADDSLGLATQLQRWIVGRTLCTDDTATVVSLAGSDLRAPFYLCIVQPDQNENEEEEPVHLNNVEVNNEVSETRNDSTTNKGDFFTDLIKLEKQSLVKNVEPFECDVCLEECAAGAGVVLRECIHTFCRDCLSDVVQHCQEPVVACPATCCSGFLQEREIRGIVTWEVYEQWLARGLATAESGTRNAFHCRTRDCSGWAFCDPGVRRFPCPVCKKTNCVQCQAIHEGESCERYQTKLRETVTAAQTSNDDEGTQALLTSLISRGEALECPECKAIITKKWGCDWVKCSACKTEICWVTKGRRWGPGGRGDTSSGCRCGVDGQRCHPSCGYCH